VPFVREFVMTTITKRDLVSQIAEFTKFPRDTVKWVMQAALDEIVKELCKGNRIEFRDFGVFEPKERRARRAQNPKTKLVQEVGPKRTVRFKAGRLMKEAVAQGSAEVETLTKRKIQPSGTSRKPGSAGGAPGAVELKLTGRRGNPRRVSKPSKPQTETPSLKLSSGL
jgi:nucleoid DNA-binding protein